MCDICGTDLHAGPGGCVVEETDESDTVLCSGCEGALLLTGFRSAEPAEGPPGPDPVRGPGGSVHVAPPRPAAPPRPGKARSKTGARRQRRRRAAAEEVRRAHEQAPPHAVVLKTDCSSKEFKEKLWQIAQQMGLGGLDVDLETRRSRVRQFFPLDGPSTAASYAAWRKRFPERAQICTQQTTVHSCAADGPAVVSLDGWTTEKAPPGVDGCAGCGVVGQHRCCAGCESARYCSRECQVRHWREGHERYCRKPE